ncbi:MAG TPA: hypothetical protein VH500_07555 [Nitrososphaeraceae archaeon]
MDEGLRGYYNGSNNSHNDYKYYIKWFLIYVGVGFVIASLIPFPASFIVYLIVFFLLNFIRTDLRLRRSGTKDGIRGLYRSLSSGYGSNNVPENPYNNPIKFLCMNCGNEHKERSCPSCGSTAVRTA